MRILIAEDDQVLADGLLRSLRTSGAVVDHVANGAEADTALVTHNHFDLLILDLGLPRIHGLEVLRRLRSRGDSLPVLILTAADAVEERVKGLDLGADDYMAKPFSLQELEARVRALARRGMGNSTSTIKHGPLTYDQAGRVATIDGKMVELSVRVDDVEMSSFGCDGVIVSTPTGSTAYAFSAGGPIMWPNVKALQLIPLAAHALFARPLIIGSGSTFTIDILDDSMSEGWICCDGRRQRALPQGTRVMVRESRDTLRLARLSGVPFTNRLVSKFDLPVVGWREHARNEASSQSLHHGHTFPAAAYAAGVAVAGLCTRSTEGW